MNTKKSEKAEKVKKPKKAKKEKAEKPTPKKKGRKRHKNYVDPKVFEDDIVHFYNTGEIRDQLGKDIFNIAHRLGFRPNFINYSYKEEMVGDAVVKMFAALKNKKFDPSKGYNPFSYYTKIAFNAFRNRIKKEKKAHAVLVDYQEEVYNTLVDAGHVPTPSNTHNDYDNE